MRATDPDISRLLKALRNEIPDRVPNFEYLIGARNVSAILDRECGTSWNLCAADYVELVRNIGMDAIGGHIFIDGGQLLSGVPKGALKDRDSYKDLLQNRAIAPSPIDLEQLDEYFEAVSNTAIGVWVHLSAGLTMLYDTIGLAEFCLLLYDDPPLIGEIFDRIVEDNLRLLRELLKYDFSFIHIGDDLGHKSGLLFPPEVLRELWMPRVRRTIAPIHDRDIPVTFHCDGMIEEAIPMIVDLGFCSLNPIEPYGMEIGPIKHRYGDKLCLVGNIDVAGPLAFGSMSEVEEDVREHLELLAPGGGYVCATSHSVIDGIPPENFRAMIDAVHKWGIYS